MSKEKTKKILSTYEIQTDTCGRWVYIQDVQSLVEKIIKDCVEIANKNALSGEPGEAIKKHFNI